MFLSLQNNSGVIFF
uniref:Uncharacterized protein n=1 Tax=Anguilla anguilla TaxID=7936 RepID=A0A0E9XNN4_ANGAN